MSTQLEINNDVYQYIVKNSLKEHPILAELRAKTRTLPYVEMMASADEAQLIALLLKIMGAKHVVEVGVFTGCTTLAMALALPEDGSIIACDTSEEWTAIGREYWQKAGVDQKIDLRLGKAEATLNSLMETKAECIDVVFIDADKQRYPTYYEQALTLLRPGGVMLLDNLLWSGQVVDETVENKSAQVIRALTVHIHQDERVDFSLNPIADGLGIVRKR